MCNYCHVTRLSYLWTEWRTTAEALPIVPGKGNNYTVVGDNLAVHDFVSDLKVTHIFAWATLVIHKCAWSSLHRAKHVCALERYYLHLKDDTHLVSCQTHRHELSQ